MIVGDCTIEIVSAVEESIVGKSVREIVNAVEKSIVTIEENGFDIATAAEENLAEEGAEDHLGAGTLLSLEEGFEDDEEDLLLSDFDDEEEGEENEEDEEGVAREDDDAEIEHGVLAVYFVQLQQQLKREKVPKPYQEGTFDNAKGSVF